MSKKLITPTYFNDSFYIYYSDGIEQGKAMYLFEMSGNTIVRFVPLRYLGKNPEIVLPNSPMVFISDNASREEMDKLKADGKKSFFYECVVHKNQRYVRTDEMRSIVIGQGVFKDYNFVTLINPSSRPLSWHPKAFRKGAHVNFVAPKGAVLKVVEHEYALYKKDGKTVYDKEFYPLVANKDIFDAIDGHMSTSKDKYKFVREDKVELPHITVNDRQFVSGGIIEDINPELTGDREYTISADEIYANRETKKGGPSTELIDYTNEYLKSFPYIQEIAKILFTKTSNEDLAVIHDDEYFSLDVGYKVATISFTSKGRFNFYIENEFESFGLSVYEDGAAKDGTRMSFYMAGNTQSSPTVVDPKELFNKFSEDDKESFNKLVYDTLDELQEKYLDDPVM